MASTIVPVLVLLAIGVAAAYAWTIFGSSKFIVGMSLV